MLYLLDSDWLIDYLDDVPEAVTLIEPLISDGLGLSIITYIDSLLAVKW